MQQETFPTLELFGKIMEYRLKPVGKQLVKVCHRSLSHNHGRVRVAALKAICRYQYLQFFVEEHLIFAFLAILVCKGLH